MVATYNERANAERLCREILGLNRDLDVLFVDDNSPDGTGGLLDALAQELSPVHVQHRSGKLGVGSAHAHGLRWAYDQGYSRLVTMDGDFTHEPRYIPDLLAESARSGADVVVGSRYLLESSLDGWNPWRKALTRTGHLLTRVLLQMPYDATNAFRCYRLDRVPRQLFDVVVSRGYSFFFESLYVLHRNRFRIAEVPVPLPNRTYGSSKMSLREVQNSVQLLFAICFKALFNPEKFEVGEDVAVPGRASELRDDQGWDDYWDAQRTGAGALLYDAVAAFYRKWIIRPTLNRFVRRYFTPGSRVLHAGCGGGQVDADIRNEVSITGLDISLNALRLYKKVNRNAETLHASIFEIPLPDGAVDGVYNLGVMEHFTEAEIQRILREFRRVLRLEGRVLVFWPPEFGMSVLFFKSLVWIFTYVLRKKDVKFHPGEITRVRSRRHVTELFESAGFQVIRYSFGPRDLFTYVVVAAQKA
jgi:dolichol-phosphate mannosyltransferase